MKANQNVPSQARDGGMCDDADEGRRGARDERNGTGERRGRTGGRPGGTGQRYRGTVVGVSRKGNFAVIELAGDEGVFFCHRSDFADDQCMRQGYEVDCRRRRAASQQVTDVRAA